MYTRAEYIAPTLQILNIAYFSQHTQKAYFGGFPKRQQISDNGMAHGVYLHRFLIKILGT